MIGEAVESKLVEHGVAAVLGFARRNAADLQPQHGVAERRPPWQQQILLQHVADILRLTGDLAAMPADTPGIRRQQSAQGVEQRGLAAAGGPDNADDLSLPERQAEVANDRYDAAADLITLRNMLHHERRDWSTIRDCLGIPSVLTDAGSHHFRLATALSANVLSMI